MQRVLPFFLFFFSFGLLNAQDSCTTRFIQLKNLAPTSVVELEEQYDILDSLLSHCNYTDSTWTYRIIETGMQLGDTLVNEPFLWKYYVHIYRQEKNKEKLDLAEFVINYAEENGFYVSGDYYIEAGISYRSQGMLVKELEYFKKAFEAYKRDESENITYAIAMTGELYEDLGEYEEALSYHQEALIYSRRLEVDYIRNYNLTNNYNSIARQYHKLNEADSSMKYIELAFEYSQQQNNKNSILTVLAEGILFSLESDDKLNVVPWKRIGDSILTNTNKSELHEEYLNYYRFARSKCLLMQGSDDMLVHPDTLIIGSENTTKTLGYLEYGINYMQSQQDDDGALMYSKQLNSLLKEQSTMQNQSAFSFLLEKQRNSELVADNIKLEKTTRSQRWSMSAVTIISLLLTGIVLYSVFWIRRVKRLNRKIATRNSELSVQKEEIERVAYAMTHDLKEPANTAKVFAAMLSKTDQKSPAQNKAVDIVQTASRSLVNSINALHSYLIVGKSSDLSAVNTNELLEEVMTDLSLKIENSNAKIKYINLPTITAHRNDLKLVFQNIISNSLKYRNDKIKTVVEIMANETTTHHYFSVTDNGIGIPKSMHENVFDLFSRCTSVADSESSGIGLANVKKIVNNHGGRVWLDSEEGEWTKVFFTISKKIEKI